MGQLHWHNNSLTRCSTSDTIPVDRTEDEAYDTLKIMLSHAPVVQPPDWARPFHVFVDASDIAIGSALMQLKTPNWYQPVYYSSRKLSTAKRNYSTTEREALGMIYNINKFWHYPLGQKLTFHVGHVALLYLVSKQALTGKLTRWMMLLQEFDFDIQHRPRTQHVVADYLSRIENRADDDDHFPDGAILHMEAGNPERSNEPHKDKWLTKMSTFLSTGLPPPRMRTDEKATTESGISA